MSLVKTNINVNSITPELILRLETINEQLKVKIQENEKHINYLKTQLNMIHQQLSN
jgi:hypothetical protein